MDSELVSFRIDATLRRAAASVCASLGLDLNDYLRQCITHLIQEKQVPFASVAPGPAGVAKGTPNDARQLSPLNQRVAVEAALIRLRGDVAEKTSALVQARSAKKLDQQLVERLSVERESALLAVRELDVGDTKKADQVLERFSGASSRTAI
jgi:antitoxin component of RelBE/YafQ-DinJ toxin-antitoxin module